MIYLLLLVSEKICRSRAVVEQPKIKLKEKVITGKMRNKLWKIRLTRLKVSSFTFALCLWIDKFQQSQGSKSGMSPASATAHASSYEKIPEVQENSPKAIESTERPWVPKCCNLTYGYSFEHKSFCVETEDEFLPDFEDRPDYSQTARGLPVKTRYEYYIGDPCSDGKYILDLTTYLDDRYSIYTNGTLLYSDRLYGKEEFCLETLNRTIRVFMCFDASKPNRELNLTYVVYAVALLISIPFLLATALIYLCVENFRDLRGKSLSCHVLCLATAYLVLATVQLSSDQLDEGLCIAAGFLIQFFFIASFFWLNVICYDTWRCMSGGFQPINSRSEKVEFLKYSLYGWYAPVILSIVTLIMDLEPAIPESYLKPNFGLKSCWFYSDHAALPYFYGPIAIIIFINIIFFYMSARKIYLEHKKREECKARNRNSMEEIREINMTIRLYIKTLQECIYLFCLMGITWAAEVLSWAVDGSQEIWLITDIFNALQGVVIFYLFVIKPINVRNEVKHRVRDTWNKIIKCNGEFKEENKRIARHNHPELQYETDEYLADGESNRFLPDPTTVTVPIPTTTTAAATPAATTLFAVA